jgi:rhamnopyranosyl-N-acetylglucosaminyl-diphospho-decaprenol beta-1,3/1,4-galactofuranosyltransferase
MKLAACVLTYNRKDLLLKCLAAIRRQTCSIDAIVLVDNGSTDATADTLQEAGWFSESSFHYIWLEENIGSAGGFFTCIKYALEQGYDWIWIMDDDVIAAPTALERLLQHALDEKHANVGGLISQNESPNTEARYRLPKSITEALRYVVSCPIDRAVGKHGLLPVDWCHLASFLMPTAVARQIGYPRKEFFLYCEDIDFTLRIRKAGYSLFLVTDSLIDHPVGVAVVKKAGEAASLRWYYNYRNHIANIIIQHGYLGASIAASALVRISLGAARRIFLTLLQRDYRAGYLIFLALLHGYLLRLGKYNGGAKARAVGASVAGSPQEFSGAVGIPGAVAVAASGADSGAAIKSSSETAV